jgi:hypothetical protein
LAPAKASSNAPIRSANAIKIKGEMTANQRG